MADVFILQQPKVILSKRVFFFYLNDSEITLETLSTGIEQLFVE